MEGSEKEIGVKCDFGKAARSPGEKQADGEDAAGCKIRTRL